MIAATGTPKQVIAAIEKDAIDIDALLHFAARFNENPSVITALIKKGANVNAQDDKGETPLKIALGRNNETVTKVLRDAENGIEKFSELVKTGSPAEITNAINAGANVNAKEKDGGTPLYRAAGNNKNPEVIDVLVKAGASANAKADNGDTPLHFAAEHNSNPEIIITLIQAGAEVNAKNNIDSTPLHYAARHNQDSAVIAVLIKAGADVNAKDDNGKTPIEIALDRKNLSIAETLLDVGGAKYSGNISELVKNGSPAEIEFAIKAGADANAKSGNAPLCSAARYNQDSAVIAVLIKAGADVNAKDGLDKTALHLAAEYNQNPAVSATLIKAGADVNAKDGLDKTALHLAAEYNQNPAVSATLIEAGADVNAKDGRNMMPLSIAIAQKNAAVAQVLRGAGGIENYSGDFFALVKTGWPIEIANAIKGGANVNAKDKNGMTPLHYAAENNKNAEVVVLLVKAGADINSKENTGETPLHRAVKSNGNPEVVVALIKAGATVDSKEVHGWTPLHIAAKDNNYPEVIVSLAKAGANVNARDNEGRTPLKIALDAGKHPAAEALRSAGGFQNYTGNFISLVERTQSPDEVADAIKRGADVSVKGYNGNTPLHYAAGDSQNADVVAVLIKSGANVNAKNNDGMTPLHYVVSNDVKNTGVIAVLIKAGADVNAKDKKLSTPLHYAAYRGQNPEIVAALINAGAEINAKDKNDNTPLHYAAQRSAKITAVLIRAGADINVKNADSKTPLSLATENYQRDTAELLRTATSTGLFTVPTQKIKVTESRLNGNANAEKYNGNFFELARTGSVVEVADAINAGAALNAKNDSDLTPLHYAAYGNPHAEVIAAMIQAGADVNAKAKGDWTPLHYAAQNNKNPEIFTALINAGAEVNAIAGNGITPLKIALAKENTVAAQALRDAATTATGTNYRSVNQLPMSYENQLAAQIGRIVGNYSSAVSPSATLKLTMMQSGRASGCEIKKSASSNNNLEAFCKAITTYFGQNPLPDATQNSSTASFDVDFSGLAPMQIVVTRLPTTNSEPVVYTDQYPATQERYVESTTTYPQEQFSNSNKLDDNSERKRKIKKGLGIAAGIGLNILKH
ncbi:hypothetical protein FACS1894139_08850 [Planctomycetales bacterium]|nr:hypothetical protein FACS1894107_14800 [Planctomycetales bacterium]GHS98188.1 hypothetical protein FACS1894108_05900 [Planctomycetales bacterium]GHT05294.1 hypothetical protein FACS1894139_08850 [Planctomycetales bacterium]